MPTKDEDDREFQLEVIERLTRIETKQDVTNGTVKQNCEDIKALQKTATEHSAQWSLLKKITASCVGIVGPIIAILTFLLACHII